jgi:hypothetical protein
MTSWAVGSQAASLCVEAPARVITFAVAVTLVGALGASLAVSNHQSGGRSGLGCGLIGLDSHVLDFGRGRVRLSVLPRAGAVGQQFDGQQQATGGQPTTKIGCRVSVGAAEMLATSDVAMPRNA